MNRHFRTITGFVALILFWILLLSLSSCVSDGNGGTRFDPVAAIQAIFTVGQAIADNSGIPGAGLAWAAVGGVVLTALGLKHRASGLPGTEWRNVCRDHPQLDRVKRKDVLKDRRAAKKAAWRVASGGT
jgi:hypothetical protein